MASGLCEPYQLTVACPGHARELERDLGGHVGQVREASHRRIKQPGVGDLRRDVVVGGVCEVDAD